MKGPVSCKTRVIVVQHPHEARRTTISSVPLIPLCLREATVIVGEEFKPGASPVLDAALASPQTCVLWPNDAAPPLREWLQEQLEKASPAAADAEPAAAEGNNITLLAIDGTWRQARKLVRLNPRLLESAAQQCQLTGDEGPSLWSFRKEERGHHVSTLEAVAQALAATEVSGRGL
jgi:DTW domain-containing protein